MNIDNLTLKEMKQIAALMNGVEMKATPAFVAGDQRAVIVRSRDAGVQFGYLLGYTGREVHLRDARQMWQWKAAKGGTLLDCATHGVNASNSKFSGPVSKIIVLEACAIIDCTPECVNSIKSVKWT
jgi:hypothetical protein